MKKLSIFIFSILLLFGNFSISHAASDSLSFVTCKPVNKSYYTITGQTTPLLENSDEIYNLPDESIFDENASFIVNNNDNGYFDNVRYGWMFCPTKNRKNPYSSNNIWYYDGITMSYNNANNAPKIYFNTLKESERAAKKSKELYLVKENTVNLKLNTDGGKVEGYEDNIFPFTYYTAYLPTITNFWSQPQTEFEWTDNNCEDLPTPIKPGYVFKGWFITYDDGSILHNGDTDYQLTKKSLLNEIDLVSYERNAKNNQMANFRETKELIATWEKISDDVKIGINCVNAENNLQQYYTIPNSQSKKDYIDEENETYIMSPDFVIGLDDELVLPDFDNISVKYANYNEPIEYKFEGWYAKRTQNKDFTYEYSDKLEKINKDNLINYIYIPRTDAYLKYCDYILAIYPKWSKVTKDTENDTTNIETDNNKQIDEKDTIKSTDNTITPQTKEIKNPESQGATVTPTSDDVKIEIAKITGLKAVNKKGKKISLKWKKLNDVKKYEVQISTKKNMKKVKKYTTSKNTYDIKKLKKGKNYYIRVRGINGDNIGKWSKIVKVKIKK